MIEVTIQRTNTTLSVIIKDDGQGMAQQKKKKGLGLHTMHYRAKAIGATLDIATATDGGTVVTLQGAMT